MTDQAMQSVRDRLTEIAKSLNSRYVERSELVTGLLTAAVAQQHIFVLGPPGEAKTELIEDFGQCIDGRVFDVTMMKTTTVDELFGPPNVKSYREDGVYERVTRNMAPEAHLLSLDEIWKGGSATLNGLLRLLAQRKYQQGHQWLSSPLLFAVGSSNELPTDPSLRAMYSRFQLRYVVDKVKSSRALSTVLWGSRPDLTETRVTVDELGEAHKQAAMLPWTKEAKKAFKAILSDLVEVGVKPDTRKLVALASDRGSIVQAAAWLDGAEQVEAQHLCILASCFWDTPKQIDAVAGVVTKHATSVGDKLLTNANDLIELANAYDYSDQYSRDTYIEMIRKAGVILREAEAVGITLPQATTSELEYIREQAAKAATSTSTSSNTNTE